VGCYAGTQIANDLLGAREGTEPPSSLRVIGGFFVLYNRDTQITAHPALVLAVSAFKLVWNSSH